MSENRVRSARLTQDIQDKVEAYQSVFGWDFGQTVTQLFNYRQRIMNAVADLEVVRCSDGSIDIIHGPSCQPGNPVIDAKHIAVWLVQELEKSIAEGFREPLFGAREEEEEVN